MKKLSCLVIISLFLQINAQSQYCLPNGITFTTQSQIDSFQINYPNCTEIQGDVLISGDSITNLNKLKVLTSLGGNLSIKACYNLMNLIGLDSVTSIAGNFEIGDYYWFGYYMGNPTLIDLAGLSNLTSIGGHLSILFNNSLNNLSGFDNLTSIGGGLRIQKNDTMTNLTGLGNLITIGGGLIIGGTYGNPRLTDLTGIEGLTTIGGDLEISHNNDLTCLTGLDNVNFIGGNLIINGNTNLTSLTGLNNLTSIGGNLQIRHNNSLTSLIGLNNIDANSIDSLFIYSNKSLSTCEVKSVCDYLASPNASISIYDNTAGCNSQAEVDSACATVSLENVNIRNQISIFPNPTNNEIFISSDNRIVINEVNIYNRLEQMVLQETKNNAVIDVSNLPEGLYIVELISDNYVIRRKLLVQ